MFSCAFSFAVGTAVTLLSLGGLSVAEDIDPLFRQGAYYYIQSVATSQYVKSVEVLKPLALTAVPDHNSVWFVSSVGSNEVVFRSARGWHAYSNGNSSLPITDDPNDASHWLVQGISSTSTTIVGPNNSSFFWAVHTGSDKVWIDKLDQSPGQQWKFSPTTTKMTVQMDGY